MRRTGVDGDGRRDGREYEGCQFPNRRMETVPPHTILQADSAIPIAMPITIAVSARGHRRCVTALSPRPRPAERRPGTPPPP